MGSQEVKRRTPMGCQEIKKFHLRCDSRRRDNGELCKAELEFETPHHEMFSGICYPDAAHLPEGWAEVVQIPEGYYITTHNERDPTYFCQQCAADYARF